jgi:seryl-tRNA synthetase
MRRFCQGLKKRRGVKRAAPTPMDREATKQRAQRAQREQRDGEEAKQREQREREEVEKIEEEMREIEKLLPRLIKEDLRRTQQERYYQLLKKKLKKESEETESEPEAEPKEEETLHGIKKFKINEETIDKLLKSHHGQAHAFFVHLADSLPSISKTMRKCANILKISAIWPFV